jgi:hypothetical protein
MGPLRKALVLYLTSQSTLAGKSSSETNEISNIGQENLGLLSDVPAPSILERFVQPWSADFTTLFSDFVPIHFDDYKGASDLLEQAEHYSEHLGACLADDNDLPPELVSVRDEISLLHRELLKTTDNSPTDTCPSEEVAVWVKTVNEQCYALAGLEASVEDAMNLAREPGKLHEDLN